MTIAFSLQSYLHGKLLLFKAPLTLKGNSNLFSKPPSIRQIRLVLPATLEINYTVHNMSSIAMATANRTATNGTTGNGRTANETTANGASVNVRSGNGTILNREAENRRIANGTPVNGTISDGTNLSLRAGQMLQGNNGRYVLSREIYDDQWSAS